MSARGPARPARPARGGAPAARGLTLIELLVVIVLIAIVAAIAVPLFTGGIEDATASTLRASVTQVGMVLEHQRQRTPDGSWPAALETTWFVGHQMPAHPERPLGVPLVEIVSKPGEPHPRVKTLNDASPGAYWYNRATGAFRARVAARETPEETLAFYELVNQVELGPDDGTGTLGEGTLKAGKTGTGSIGVSKVGAGSVGTGEAGAAEPDSF